MSCRSPPSPSSHISLSVNSPGVRQVLIFKWSFYFFCGEEKRNPSFVRLPVGPCDCMHVSDAAPLFTSTREWQVFIKDVSLFLLAWRKNEFLDLSVTTWSARIYRNYSYWKLLLDESCYILVHFKLLWDTACDSMNSVLCWLLAGMIGELLRLAGYTLASWEHASASQSQHLPGPLCVFSVASATKLANSQIAGEHIVL